MIGIKLDVHDDFLELAPETSIALKLENPLLGDADKISPGSFSYPFDLPVGESSPKNAAMLKNPQVVENNEAFSIQSGTLFFNGLPMKKGNLKTRGTKGNRVTSNFLFGLSQISPDFKTAKLRDVLDENIVIDATPITKIIYVKRNVAGDWNVTVNGKTYTGTTANDIKTQMVTDYWASLDSGKYVATCEEILVGNSPGGITPTYLKIYLSLRYSYYDEILMMTFELDQTSTDPLHELHVAVDAPSDYSVESFDLDSYYDGFDSFFSSYITSTPATNKFRIPICFNANPYGSTENIKESEIINAVGTTGIIRNVANVSLTGADRIKNYNSLQPFVMLKHVVDKIATEFGFQVEGDFYTAIGNRLLHNTASLDVVQNYINDEKFVFWRRSFNMNELVPDVSVVEFFSALASRYNLAVWYNENTLKVTLQMREPIALSKTYIDLTSLCGPKKGDEDERITGYTLRVPKEDTDEFSVDEIYMQGTSQQEFPIKMGSVRNTQIAVIEEQGITGVRVKQKNADKFDFRVFHYEWVADGAVFDYAASRTDLTGAYEALNDFVTLQGLHTVYFKYWLNALTRRRVVMVDVRFPFRTLRNFNWAIKYRFDRVNYWVKSIDARLTNTGIEVSDVELITMH